jgi:hypothetical protein
MNMAAGTAGRRWLTDVDWKRFSEANHAQQRWADQAKERTGDTTGDHLCLTGLLSHFPGLLALMINRSTAANELMRGGA